MGALGIAPVRKQFRLVNWWLKYLRRCCSEVGAHRCQRHLAQQDDKSTLLFRRCVPTTATFSCICLTNVGTNLKINDGWKPVSTDHLRLINFSPGDQEVLKTCIMENCLPGVTRVDSSG